MTTVGVLSPHGWFALEEFYQPAVAKSGRHLMIDRALYARWLYQESVALGWHPVMRITHQSKFRKGRSKTSVPVTAMVPWLWDDPPLGTHCYEASMVRLVIQIVGTGVALRAVPRVLQSTAAEWGRSGPIPHWTTVRLCDATAGACRPDRGQGAR